jgi:hypothetical protein
MDTGEKYRLWLIAGASLAALLVLASGISEMKLTPGWPWSVWWQLLFGDSKPTGSLAPSIPFQGLASRQAWILAVIFLALMVMYLVASILYPGLWLQMLRVLLQMLALLLVVSLLMHSGFLDNLTQMMQLLGFVNPKVPEGGRESLPPFAANSPPWLTWIAGFILALALVAGVIGVVWAFSRRRARSAPMRELEQGAQAALDALQGGADFRNTVLRCYREMSEVLRTQRGIQREGAMTPREFEERLIRWGLPGTPVRQLTRLFEAARYGAATPDELEEDQAITCLKAIVEACRRE